MTLSPVEESEFGVSGCLDTKQRLLDAAVKIFSEKGFHATSMRAITQEAQTSLSAANYHFGTKEELLRLALQQRVKLFNDRRLTLLQKSKKEAGEATLSIEQVFEAYLQPFFERRTEWVFQGVSPAGLAIRLYLDMPEFVARVRKEAFTVINHRFVTELEEALPGFSSCVLEEALQLGTGVAIHAAIDVFEMNLNASDEKKRAGSRLENTVRFVAAGVCAVNGGPFIGPSDLGENS